MKTAESTLRNKVACATPKLIGQPECKLVATPRTRYQQRVRTIYRACALLFLAGTARAAEPAPAPAQAGVITASVEEVRAMLSKKLTLEELEMKLGPPIFARTENWGNVGYWTVKKELVIFWYYGPYVASAVYGVVNIPGVPLKKYRFDFGYDYTKGKFTSSVDRVVFEDFASLKARLEKLPPASILEWQHNCDGFGGGKQEEFAQFLKQLHELIETRGIILIQYPSG